MKTEHYLYLSIFFAGLGVLLLGFSFGILFTNHSIIEDCTNDMEYEAGSTEIVCLPHRLVIHHE